MVETCENCKYTPRKRGFQISGQSVCRRFPPQIAADFHDRQPLVLRDGWCGEWKRQPSEAEL